MEKTLPKDKAKTPWQRQQGTATAFWLVITQGYMRWRGNGSSSGRTGCHSQGIYR